MNTNPNSQGDALNDLVGSKLISIIFILDYLQLVFEQMDPQSGQYSNLGLTILVWPILEQDGETYAFGGNEYFDVMYRQISATVIGCSENPMNELVVELSTKLRLSISLRLEDQVGPETAILNNDLTLVTTVW